MDPVESRLAVELQPTSLSIEHPVQPAESFLVPRYPFACWQIALLACFTGYLGAGSLIAVNFLTMNYRVMAILILVISGLMSHIAFVHLIFSTFWIPPLLMYLIARSLFTGRYAPFRRPFDQLSRPPGRFGSLWHAVGYALTSWGLMIVVLILIAFCLDLANLIFTTKPTFDEIRLEKAGPLE